MRGVTGKSIPPGKTIPALTLTSWHLKTIIPGKFAFVEGYFHLFFYISCLIPAMDLSLQKGYVTFKIVMTLYTMKSVHYNFANYLCRKLGDVPLQKHNFSGAIIFKCCCIKIGGVISLSVVSISGYTRITTLSVAIFVGNPFSNFLA